MTMVKRNETNKAMIEAAKAMPSAPKPAPPPTELTVEAHVFYGPLKVKK